MPLFEHKEEAVHHARTCARVYGKGIGVERTEDNLWEASEAAATPFAVFIAYPSEPTETPSNFTNKERIS
jgi:hypothetical protein